MALTRRDMVRWLGTAPALACAADLPVFAAPATGEATAPEDRSVHLAGDGIGLTPRGYATLLGQLVSTADVKEDTYLLGGEVERFEQHWARLLGKERAVFMPSGTLANHLALRALAGSRRRVIVPEMSHVYNDTGDACQTLSGQTLVPLGAGAATFTQKDVEAVLARTASGRVATAVGAILVESPIRRLSGAMFDWDEAKRICAFARERDIGTHLDGARLFIASAHGHLARGVRAPFDTVRVAVEVFNSGIGAILAGPSRLLDDLFHVRRMFGGNLAAGWQAALVARHYMDGFVDRLKTAVKVSEDFYTALASHPRVALERIPNGTNVTRVTVKQADLSAVAGRLAEQGVRLPAAGPGGVVTLGVNETWNRVSAPSWRARSTRRSDDLVAPVTPAMHAQ